MDMTHKSVLSALLLACLAFSAVKGQGKVLFTFHLLQRIFSKRSKIKNVFRLFQTA